MKRSLQARADKLGTLGCKVALTHLSRKGRVSHINSASLTQALQASTPEQQLAMQQQFQDKPDVLLQLMQVLLHWRHKLLFVVVGKHAWLLMSVRLSQKQSFLSRHYG